MVVGCQERSSEVKTEVLGTWSTDILMEGTDFETSVFHYDTGVPGQTLFIVGGIHGNETAGFKAATILKEEATSLIKEGDLYFLPEANKPAIANELRYPKSEMDLNRAFTGEGDFESTLNLAREIKSYVIQASPDLVIDHHESLNNYKNKRLGNTLIVSDVNYNLLEGLDMIELIVDMESADIPFILESNPPVGSINRTLSEENDMLVVTIETNRKLPLETRIDQQLEVARRLIDHYSNAGE